MHIFKIPKVIYGIYNRFIWEIEEKEKNIYLTFDDGPNPDTTGFILDLLDQFNAKASFFCVGENVVKYPEQYQEIIKRGHSVGNHTYNHLNNREFSTDDYVGNVKKCSEHIDSTLFRPPYGRISQEQAGMLLNAGYQIIMYSVLTNDFNPKLSKDYILRKSLKISGPGSIVVFHDSKKAFDNVKEVLPEYLDYFHLRGYSFKKLDANSLENHSKQSPKLFSDYRKSIGCIL